MIPDIHIHGADEITACICKWKRKPVHHPRHAPTLIDPPKGDAFACRNEYALNIDYEEMPPMFKITDTHYAATWLLDPRAPQIKSPVGGTAHE